MSRAFAPRWMRARSASLRREVANRTTRLPGCLPLDGKRCYFGKDSSKAEVAAGHGELFSWECSHRASKREEIQEKRSMITPGPQVFSRCSFRRPAFFFFLLFSTLAASRLWAVPPKPVPFVDIVSPVSILPGSTGVTITVRGTGFVAASLVRWNGVALATTFVNARQLTAAVPDDFLAAVGLGTITVVSPAPGGGTSNVSYIQVASQLAGTNFPATPSSSINVGAGPEGIATGDFDGDGKIDLAVANAGTNTVSILKGNGDGTFTALAPVVAGNGADRLATGDFNEDGKLDLAVANSAGRRRRHLHVVFVARHRQWPVCHCGRGLQCRRSSGSGHHQRQR
jgi:hypothetical protein